MARFIQNQTWFWAWPAFPHFPSEAPVIREVVAPRTGVQQHILLTNGLVQDIPRPIRILWGNKTPKDTGKPKSCWDFHLKLFISTLNLHEVYCSLFVCNYGWLPGGNKSWGRFECRNPPNRVSLGILILREYDWSIMKMGLNMGTKKVPSRQLQLDP